MGLEMELQQRVGNGMVSTLKDVYSANAGETAEQLRQRLANTKDELDAAIQNFDLEEMTFLKKVIKSLPEKILIAEICELRLRLKTIEIEREQTAQKIKDINLVRKQKNFEYAQKIKELETYAAAVNEWNVKHSFAKNDSEILLSERRELNQRLNLLTEKLHDE